jgi:hypothetical protein
MAPMTEIGSPRKFGIGRRGLGSKNVGVICERQRLQRIDQKGNTKNETPVGRFCKTEIQNQKFMT